MISQPAVQFAVEFVFFAQIDEDAPDFGDDADAPLAHEHEDFFHPFLFVKRSGESGQNAALLGGGNVVQNLVQTAFLIAENIAQADGAFAPGNARDVAKFVADEDQFQGLRGVESAALLSGVFHGCYDGRELLVAFELIGVFENLVERGDLRLGLAGGGEGGEEFVGVGDRLLAQDDGVGLFGGEGDETVLFEELLGAVPPAFELRFVEDFAGKRLGDLILRGFAAVVAQDGADEGQGVFLG